MNCHSATPEIEFCSGSALVSLFYALFHILFLLTAVPVAHISLLFLSIDNNLCHNNPLLPLCIISQCIQQVMEWKDLRLH